MVFCEGLGIAKYRLMRMWASSSEPPDNASSPRSLILTDWLLWFNFWTAPDSSAVMFQLVRSSKRCIADFASTEEAFCCPDSRVTTWALCAEARSARLAEGRSETEMSDPGSRRPMVRSHPGCSRFSCGTKDLPLAVSMGHPSHG